MRGPMATLLASVLIACAALTSAAAENAAQLIAALRAGGHIAVMRHALAPGGGDPPDFRLADCATQRNLSEQGRQQAVKVGEVLRANGISSAAVFASQWCRTRETAALLGLGPVMDQPAANSFMRQPERRAPQTEELKAWIAKLDLSRPTVLVSHQVNISALTSIFPGSGEIVVLRRLPDGSLSVVGRIATEP